MSVTHRNSCFLRKLSNWSVFLALLRHTTAAVSHTIVSSWHYCTDCNLITTMHTQDTPTLCVNGVTHESAVRSTRQWEEKPLWFCLFVLFLHFNNTNYSKAQLSLPLFLCVCTSWPLKGCWGWRACTPGRWTRSPLFTHTCESSQFFTWVESVFSCLSSLPLSLSLYCTR